MMAKDSFRLLLPNLFIGLCKGSRLLHPYSKQFYQELGYRLFQFEPSFKIVDGRAHPDAVLRSEKVKHTLLVEWTEAASIHPRKQRQLSRYARVTNRDLINVLAVPPEEVKSFDVVLIVSDQTAPLFQQTLREQRWQFPLLIFRSECEEYELRKVFNEFMESETNKFFTVGIKINRIPLHFLPFPLENTTEADIVPFVIRHLLSLLVKGIKEFEVEDFCRGYVPMWKFIWWEKRHDLMKLTRQVLTALGRKPVGKELIRRVGSDPPKWGFVNPVESRKRIRSIKKVLEQFINEIQGKQYQMELELWD
ncbi:hypothetical protein DRN74_05210 [Candidatus Micrarchaeota archaeon]|nr:MAG: hypothetical protein DRN74_05210 [Candidatus Micrarchaeota archaeon]